ncbi:MAG: lamin tail domain-containing protein [bacterium]|nr:lamin tail domain-containing protein [bacterium]
MKLFYAYTCFGLLTLLPLAASAEDVPSPYFSEINWAGSEASAADEWIEIYNPVDAPADLGGYVIAGAATGGDALQIAEGTIVAGLDTLLISNYALDDERTTLEVEPDLVTSSLSLPNRDLEIMLITPDGRVIDEVIDSGAPEFGSTDPYASMIRDPETKEWMTAEETLHLPEGQFGTPTYFTLPAPIFEEDPYDTPEEVGPIEIVEEESDPIEVAEEDNVEIEDVAEIDEAEHNPIEDPIEETVVDSLDEEDELIESDPEEETLDEEFVEVVVEEVVDDLPDDIDQIEEAEESELDPHDDPVDEILFDAPVEIDDPVIVKEIIDEPTRYGDIVITEIMPNPSSGDEWAELFNASQHDIRLTSWYFEDESGRAILIEDIHLEPGEYAVIELSASYLNNSGDSLALYTDESLKIDDMQFGSTVPAPEKGQSLGRDGDTWRETREPTPKNKNTFNDIIIPTYEHEPKELQIETAQAVSHDWRIVPDEPKAHLASAAEVPTETRGSESDVKKTVTIVDIAKEQKTAQSTKSPSETKTTAILDVKTGRVTALPGLFGSQLMFIEGTAIYSYYADWPALALGDLVRVSGEETESRGEKRIKISSSNDIVVLESGNVSGTNVNTAQIQSLRPGELVTIEAKMEGLNGKELVLSDAYGTIRVLAHDNTGINWNDLAGTSMRITGIIREIHGEHSLHPRSPKDVEHIVQIAVEAAVQDEDTSDQTIVLPKTPKTGRIGAIIFSLSVLALVILFIAHAMSKKGINK